MHHRTPELGHPAAMFHRESNRHTGFLSEETRSCEDWMRGRLRGVAYQEVHWKVVLQSPTLYQSF